MFEIAFMVVVAIFLVAVIYGLVQATYVTPPRNREFIISGLKSTPRILIGTGGFSIPFL